MKKHNLSAFFCTKRSAAFLHTSEKILISRRLHSVGTTVGPSATNIGKTKVFLLRHWFSIVL